MSIKFEKLRSLEKEIGYRFKDKSILEKALTHSSYANENKMKVYENNERLEFLGDSIIGLIISQHLYKKYPKHPEGELTKLRAMIVCEPSLALAAKSISLGEYLLLGRGEEMTGGRHRESILADGMEAIVGAIYIDSDFVTTYNVVMNKFGNGIKKASTRGCLFIDYKTELQEVVQRKKEMKIEYSVYKEEGPDHDKVFYTKVYVNGETLGKGKGKNKKEAEQVAAKNALKNWR